MHTNTNTLAALALALSGAAIVAGGVIYNKTAELEAVLLDNYATAVQLKDARTAITTCREMQEVTDQMLVQINDLSDLMIVRAHKFDKDLRNAKR